ncbi:MAG: dienelactone hydrolase family protein [Pseudomonadota bacterium]
MNVTSTTFEYSDGATTFEGVVARPAGSEAVRGGVLVAHAWGGCGAEEQRRAIMLAEMGYVAFAVDLYGKGIRGSSPEENAVLMQPMLDDRPRIAERMQLALIELKKMEGVNSARTAAIGFCFGGLCVLDLARSGADVAGVVSIHGLFLPPPVLADASITSSVLALHGWDDPLVPPEQVLALATEMSAAKADWQLHAYGNTLHAFTNPNANDPDFGAVYDADADRRSWAAATEFLAERLQAG